jgi:hypothetical protein
MPRSLRVLLWVFAFTGAAGIGAFVAAHSNPFPPSVEATPPPSVALTSGPTPSTPSQVWRGTISSTTSHQLYVGGSCDTNWRGTLTLVVRADASVRGVGSVRRVGALRCDFPTSQAQIASFQLVVAGTATAHGLQLHLAEAGRTPTSGADDYGGFLRTVLAPGSRATFDLPAAARLDAAGTVSLHRVDAEGRGMYVSHTRIRVGCARRCPS